MTLEYNEIFGLFLMKITDYSFLEYDEKFISSQMKSWLRTGASSPRIRAKFSKFILDDDIDEIEFELDVSVDEQSDTDFVKELLAKSMVIEWLEPQVKTVLLTKQLLGGKEEKWFSQSSHLGELNAMLDNAKSELQKYIRDYGYIHNTYLGD